MSEPTHPWLDQVLAMPTIGIQIRPDMRLCAEFLSRAAPLINELVDAGRGIEVVEPRPLEMEFRGRDGTSITIGPRNFVVSRVYPTKSKSEAGALPVTEQVEVRPYSEHLAELRDLEGRLFVALAEGRTLRYDRIGVVASARVRRDLMPPGAADLVAHLGSPWESGITKANSLLVATLAETDEVLDRCHHRLVFDTGVEENEVQITLDWQRVYAGEGVECDPASFQETLDECADAACAYFQRFGEGDLSP